MAFWRLAWFVGLAFPSGFFRPHSIQSLSDKCFRHSGVKCSDRFVEFRVHAFLAFWRWRLNLPVLGTNPHPSSRNHAYRVIQQQKPRVLRSNLDVSWITCLTSCTARKKPPKMRLIGSSRNNVTMHARSSRIFLSTGAMAAWWCSWKRIEPAGMEGWIVYFEAAAGGQ
jgi:hypothetical protein